MNTSDITIDYVLAIEAQPGQVFIDKGKAHKITEVSPNTGTVKIYVEGYKFAMHFPPRARLTLFTDLEAA